MDNGIAGIDHVIVGVRDLERARSGWSRLGFTLSPRGRHIGQGTANYCIMFPSDYVELLGLVDADDFVQRLDDFLARREGLMAAAFAPAGAPEDVRAALLGYGLHPSEPRPLGRQRDRAAQAGVVRRPPVQGIHQSRQVINGQPERASTGTPLPDAEHCDPGIGVPAETHAAGTAAHVKEDFAEPGQRCCVRR